MFESSPPRTMEKVSRVQLKGHEVRNLASFAFLCTPFLWLSMHLPCRSNSCQRNCHNCHFHGLGLLARRKIRETTLFNRRAVEVRRHGFAEARIHWMRISWLHDVACPACRNKTGAGQWSEISRPPALFCP